jgi:microcin C transport system permease protein
MQVWRSNPVTQKRWRRFRRNRRAWVALNLLAALWAGSLVAELIANDRPLVMRFNRRWYFPVLRFYPRETFLRDGGRTRTDYRALREHPAFKADPRNAMVFAPVPFSPLESLDPASLREEETVTLTVERVPRVGQVDVLPDLSIRHALNAGFFFGVEDRQVPGRSLTEIVTPSGDFAAAIAARRTNRAARRTDLQTVLPGRAGAGLPVVLTLSTFTPRDPPPQTVRMLLREVVPPGGAWRLVCATNGAVRGAVPDAWRDLTAETRTRLETLVRECFTAPAMSDPVTDAGRLFRVEVRKSDVAWPHRPVRGHWCGIDSAGRDVFARVLYGLRTSLTFGLLLVAASMALGIAFGALQGYFGGAVDLAGQRFSEIWSALPFLYVMILLGSVYGRSLTLLLVCYGLFNWIGISYYARAEFLRLRHQPFVDAARCMGIPTRKIMFRHILPNALTPVITFFPFSLVGAIGVLAALDYLGFGLPPPTPSWGELLQQAQQFRWAWWLILYPSLAIFVVMLLGVFVGEGVRDAYDPRQFSRME